MSWNTLAKRYGLSFDAGDVADLPFDDDSFDLVVSFETIEHVPDAPRDPGRVPQGARR